MQEFDQGNNQANNTTEEANVTLTQTFQDLATLLSPTNHHYILPMLQRKCDFVVCNIRMCVVRPVMPSRFEDVLVWARLQQDVSA